MNPVGRYPLHRFPRVLYLWYWLVGLMPVFVPHGYTWGWLAWHTAVVVLVTGAMHLCYWMFWRWCERRRRGLG